MSELAYRTLRENVAAEIRTKILNQELAPSTRIVEQNLSKEFGISRGPIREALRQLEYEGLVEYTRNAGCSVKEITAADVFELYLLRSSYEILAVRLCDGQFTPQELTEMDRVLDIMLTLQDGEMPRLIACDHMLHRVIVEKSRLPRLQKAWEELNYGSNIVSKICMPYRPDLIKRQYDIHRELVDALGSGDTDTICRAIYDHYMRPVKRVIAESGLPQEDYRFFR